MDAQHLSIYILFSTGLSVYKRQFFLSVTGTDEVQLHVFQQFFLYTLQVQFTEANEKEKETPTVLL